MADINRISASLLVWTNIPAEDEPEFNEWYSREHLRSRAAEVPGFDSGRRLVAEVGAPKYIAYYEAADPETFSSKAFLQLVSNPDPLSKRFIPRFRNVIRMVGRKLGGVGRDFGGSLGVFVFDAAQEATDKVRLWLGEQLPQSLTKNPGIVRAQTFEIDSALLGASVRVHTRSNDRAPAFLVVMEGTLPEQVDAVRSSVLRDEDIAAYGGTEIVYARARTMLDVRPEKSGS